MVGKILRVSNKQKSAVAVVAMVLIIQPRLPGPAGVIQAISYACLAKIKHQHQAANPSLHSYV